MQAHCKVLIKFTQPQSMLAYGHLFALTRVFHPDHAPALSVFMTFTIRVVHCMYCTQPTI